MIEKVAVVTPTYNRAYIITKAYQSLCRQTNKNFKWVIIDDGSTDDTKSIVNSFKGNNFEIIYEKKDNGGKHTAINSSLKYLKDNELVIFLDSDDILTDNAIDLILSCWDNSFYNKNICGITFLKADIKGVIVGDKFSKDYFIGNFIDVRINQNIAGDKAEVIRADVLKKYLFPEFKGEKFLGEGILWGKIAYSYDMLFVNKIVYLCEYLEDGLTKSGRKLRTQNPYGGMEHAKVYINNKVKLTYRFKNIVLYLCYAKFAKLSYIKAWKNLKSNFLLFLLSTPFAFLLYLKWKKQRGV